MYSVGSIHFLISSHDETGQSLTFCENQSFCGGSHIPMADKLRDNHCKVSEKIVGPSMAYVIVNTRGHCGVAHNLQLQVGCSVT